MAIPHSPVVEDRESALLDRALPVVRALAVELHPQRTSAATLGPDASLEREFGLDSLARVELALRLEKACGQVIPDAAMAEAETLRDLVHALLATISQPESGSPTRPARAEAPHAGAPAPSTLLDALTWRATHESDRTHIVFVEDETKSTRLTFETLRTEAQALASGLVREGVRRGETVAIMLPTGREFFAAFYGVLFAGGVPVPLYPPARASQLESHLKRLEGILANCKARVLITFEGARRVAQLLRALNTRLEHVATVAELSRPGSTAPRIGPVAIGPDSIAFVQYTSGSTGQPKGVVLTHANLLANIDAMRRATGITSADCFVSWLPLYHDMGLIGACLGALVVGYPLVLMSPFSFLTRPARWLRTIDRHRGTVTAAPNFAYELCVNKVADDDLAGVDLSGLRYAFNGAEAVSPQTLDRFADRFAPFGLRREALAPVYGLAECALGLTFPPPGRRPRIDHIDREAFQRTGVAQQSGQPAQATLSIVSCGRPIERHGLRIVDDRRRPLPERHQGRIEFRGPSATKGYLDNPAATDALFDGDWLDTGDLGYLAEGELFVTGRAKDIIIRGGHNIHPHELEEAVGRLPGLRKGGTVVFPASDRHRGTERLVVLSETNEKREQARGELTQRIHALAIDVLGMPVDEVVLAAPRTVLKTSSGKIRRAACREAYEQGTLRAQTRPPWLQLARLTLRGMATQVSRKAQRLEHLLWGARAVIVMGCFAPVLWVAATLPPGVERRRRLSARITRAGLRAAGLPVHLVENRTAPAGPRVCVSNHASYLDALVILAALPPDVVIVAKRELRSSLVLAPIAKRLDCLFVERHDVQLAVEATRDLQDAIRRRQSIHVFAEGTFQREPGLMPFHMGAFLTAAATGAPVVPIAICGTRTAYPDGARLPRPSHIEVIFGEPLAPQGSGWQAAVKLRRASRASILAHLREPDLEDSGSARPPPAA